MCCVFIRPFGLHSTIREVEGVSCQGQIKSSVLFFLIRVCYKGRTKSLTYIRTHVVFSKVEPKFVFEIFLSVYIPSIMDNIWGFSSTPRPATTQQQHVLMNPWAVASRRLTHNHHSRSTTLL